MNTYVTVIYYGKPIYNFQDVLILLLTTIPLCKFISLDRCILLCKFILLDRFTCSKESRQLDF